MTKATILRTSMLGFLAVTICGLFVSAQVNSPKMTFRRSVAFGVSVPLRELANLPVTREYGFPMGEPAHGPAFHRGETSARGVDPVEQMSPGSPASFTVGLSVAGLSEEDCDCYQGRPDTNAAVGDTQIVEWVNVEYAVYNKSTGGQVLGPVPGNQLWQSLGGPCYENNDGDVIAQWDKVNHRWLLAQNDFNAPGYAPPYYACVAVSTSADAMGSYYVYQFPLGNNFPAYPKWGIWPSRLRKNL